jgi:hypothetical protein
MKKICLCFLILLIIPTLSAAEEDDYQAEHTLQSVFEILFDWGKEAMGFSKYRWEGSRLQLKNNLVGSTIAIKDLEVYAPAIWMNSGRAYYEKFMGLPDQFSSKAFEIQKLRSTRNYYEKCQIKDVSILIMDRDEKLASDLVGLNSIDLIGSIREAEIFGSYIRLEIDLIDWKEKK